MKFIFITFSLFSLCLFAQEKMVTNLTFTQQEDVITIQYDFQGDRDKQYNMSLFLHLESDSTYQYKPQSISGDIRNVSPGLGKEIKWAVLQDFPQGLERNDLNFVITAQPKNSNMLYYILGGGAALLGGITYMITQNGDKAEKPTGTLTIDVPGEM